MKNAENENCYKKFTKKKNFSPKTAALSKKILK